MIEYVADDLPNLGGFSSYAAGELNEALDAVHNLYFKCTNEPLSMGRVR